MDTYTATFQIFSPIAITSCRKNLVSLAASMILNSAYNTSSRWQY